MHEAEITKQEWEQWLEHPVTSSFFAKIREHREEAIRTLAYGNYAGSVSKMQVLVGAINAYTHVMGVEFKGE